MFQARILSEENQEVENPILRATMARRHQFRDYGDSIPRKIWSFLCARFNAATRRKFCKIIVKRAKSSPSLPPSLTPFTRRSQLKRIPGAIHLCFFDVANIP